MEIFRSLARGASAALIVVALLSVPVQTHAATYVVHPGDTLIGIAGRYHVAPAALARANGILNANLVRIGKVLVIPGGSGSSAGATFAYRIRPGDTLWGLATRYRISIPTIRGLNPGLGTYPLYGRWLRLCFGCSTAPAGPGPESALGATGSSSGNIYVVQPGDNLSRIAAHFGTSISALVAANGLWNPNLVQAGREVRIPAVSSGYTYNPWQARSLIVSYANYYGVAPSLPLAIGWQESGFNETKISPTGAVGVMQVEPYTARTIAALWGQQVNLYDVAQNIHAGVYWLARLLSYYGGNERLSVAAYYQGARSIARVGFYRDTIQYVADVLALQTRV